MSYSRTLLSCQVCAALGGAVHAAFAAAYTFSEDFSLQSASITSMPQAQPGSSGLHVAVNTDADHEIQAAVSSSSIDWKFSSDDSKSTYAFWFGNSQKDVAVSSAVLQNNNVRFDIAAGKSDCLDASFAYVYGGKDSQLSAVGNSFIVTGDGSVNLPIVDLIDVFVNASGAEATVADNTLSVEGLGTMNRIEAVSLLLNADSTVTMQNNALRVAAIDTVDWIYGGAMTVSTDSNVEIFDNRLEISDSLVTSNITGWRVQNGGMNGDRINASIQGNSLSVKNAQVQYVYGANLDLDNQAQITMAGNSASVEKANATSLYAGKISVGDDSTVIADTNRLVADSVKASNVYGIKVSAGNGSSILLAGNSTTVRNGGSIENAFAASASTSQRFKDVELRGNVLTVENTVSLATARAAQVSLDIGSQGTVVLSENTLRISDVGSVKSLEAARLDYGYCGLKAEVFGNTLSVEGVDTLASARLIGIYDNDKLDNDITVAGNRARLSDIARLDSYEGVNVELSDSSKLNIENNVSSLQNITSAGTIYGVLVTAVQDSEAASDSPWATVSNNRLILHNVTAEGVCGVCQNVSSAKPFSGSGNSIELSGVNSIGTIDGFDTLVLTADKTVNADRAVLELGATSIDQLASDNSVFTDKTIVLKGDLQETNFMQTAGQGISFENTTVRYESAFLTSEIKVDSFEISGDSGLGFDQNKEVFEQLESSMTANSASETLSQARLAQSAFISQAAEFTADTLMLSASDALLASGGRTTLFAAVHAGNQHYDTGSFVDLSGFHFLGGAAVQINETILTAFVEYGNANSSQHAASARGDASHDYVGAGFGLQRTFGSFRVDSALRAGTSSTDFSGRYGTENADYDSNSFYLTAHLTGTFEAALNERTCAELYGRYTYSLIDGIDETLSDSNSSRFEGDAIQTHALRFGTRILGQLKENIQWRLGAAYEQVFDGKAKGQVQGVDLAAPDIAGGSGIFEAALRTKPSVGSPWSFDFSVKGYAGAREGAAGSVAILRAF